jgi:DNA-binding beta-propeller fold protein YncE
VTVISGSGDSVLCTIAIGGSPAAIVGNPVRNRVYITDAYTSTVTVLRDLPVGIEEGPAAGLRARPSAASVIRGSLFLTGASRSELLDATGRCVARLQRGKNDLRALAPGVYFVRRAEPGADISRLVLTR